MQSLVKIVCIERLKNRNAKRNGNNGIVFFLLLLSFQFKCFIISATTYFFMSFVIKIIIKALMSVGFRFRDVLGFAQFQIFCFILDRSEANRLVS